MNETSKYVASSFTSRAPLINPPGSAMELLGIIGFGNRGLNLCLAREVAIKLIFLAVTGLAGPYVLQCFGISLGIILQLMGGLMLVGLGWGTLHKEEHLKHGAVNEIVEPIVVRTAGPGKTQPQLL